MSDKSESSVAKPKLIGRVISLVILGGTFVIVYHLGTGSEANRNRASDMGLKVPPDALFFGTIWDQDIFHCTLPVENHNDRPIEISGFDVSCSCLSVFPKSCTIAPNSKVSLDLALSLADRPENMEQPVRDMSVTIAPRIENSSRIHEGWKISGKVRGILGYIPKIAAVDGDCVAGKPSPSTSINIRSHKDLSTLQAVCEPAMANVEVITAADDRRSHTLKITPKQDIAPGRFTLIVKIRAVTSEGQKELNRQLTVIGRVVDDVQLQPASLLYGARVVGSSAQEVVTLILGKEMVLEGFESKGDGLTVVPQRQKSGAPVSYLVTQRFTQAGNQSNTLSFWLRGPGFAEARKSDLPVCYYGLAPTLNAVHGKKRHD